jgi:hypothetical protein
MISDRIIVVGSRGKDEAFGGIRGPDLTLTLSMGAERATLDPRRFRETIGLFATGVAVIIARAAEEVHAMTVNAVSSLSLDPLLVMFCPAKKSNLADVHDEPAHIYY